MIENLLNLIQQASMKDLNTTHYELLFTLSSDCTNTSIASTKTITVHDIHLFNDKLTEALSDFSKCIPIALTMIKDMQNVIWNMPFNTLAEKIDIALSKPLFLNMLKTTCSKNSVSYQDYTDEEMQIISKIIKTWNVVCNNYSMFTTDIKLVKAFDIINSNSNYS